MTSSVSVLPVGPAAADCCAPSAGLDPGLDADRIAAAAKALAEPLRVRILDVLRRSDTQVCQCELMPLFGINQSLLSHHMKKLVEAGLVEHGANPNARIAWQDKKFDKEEAQWAYYSVSPSAFQELTAWLS